MNRTLQLTFWSAAIVVSSANLHAAGKHLFVLSGQSNMARFNEKMTFVPTLEEEFGKQNVIIVKDAQGGQPIRRWYKGWKAPTANKKKGGIGDLYDRLMTKINDAIQDQDLESVTILWMQGEQDAREPTGTLYKNSLKGLFKQFENDLGRGDINFVIGRLSDFGVGNQDWPHWDAIRKVQVELANANRHVAWVDTDDLNDGVSKNGDPIKNGLHYTKEGYQKFGKRLAESAISLINGQSKVTSQKTSKTKVALLPDSYPTVNELPAQDKLADPFQFFGSERRVGTRADWEERQKEMLQLLQHYVFGPLFPPVKKYKLESRTKESLADGRIIKFTDKLLLGPNLDQSTTIIYYLHKDRESRSVLIDVLAKDDPKDEDALQITDRGYDYAGIRVSPYEKIARNIYPDLSGTRSMGWVFGINEIVNYLTHEHQFDKVLITGCSRYGRVATIVGAINKEIDLTAPITTLAHAVHHIDETMWGPGNGKWACTEYETFAGKMNRLPVDRHFLGAVIAPRAYLGIMGKEKPAFNAGHIEAYESLIPVYEWLGSKEKLGLYDHSPRGHGVEMDDLHTVLDFSDLIFFGKQPKSGKQFDQLRNPAIDSFDWKAPAPISVE